MSSSVQARQTGWLAQRRRVLLLTEPAADVMTLKDLVHPGCDSHDTEFYWERTGYQGMTLGEQSEARARKFMEETKQSDEVLTVFLCSTRGGGMLGGEFHEDEPVAQTTQWVATVANETELEVDLIVVTGHGNVSFEAVRKPAHGSYGKIRTMVSLTSFPVVAQLLSEIRREDRSIKYPFHKSQIFSASSLLTSYLSQNISGTGEKAPRYRHVEDEQVVDLAGLLESCQGKSYTTDQLKLSQKIWGNLISERVVQARLDTVSSGTPVPAEFQGQCMAICESMSMGACSLASRNKDNVFLD